jgi:hypothetical protein
MRQAIIHVLRRRAWAAMAVAFRVEIDGQEMGKLRNGENANLVVTPGSHAMQIHSSGGLHSRIVIINLIEDEEAEFTCSAGLEATIKASMKARTNRECIELRQERWRNKFPIVADQTTVPEAAMPGRPLEVVETRRSEEPIGDETRTIDNRRGNSEVTRVIRASREWSRSVTITDNRARDIGGGISVGPQWVNLHAEIKSILQRSYSISSDIRETHAEEITFQVPAGSCVQLTLHWKQIVQHGFVRVQERSRGVIEIPFKIGIAVTFDQVQQQLL